MGTSKSALGPLGSKFFSLMQAREQNQVKLGELQTALKLTPDQERTLLKRLAVKGYIFRLQKGIYLIPKRLPAGGPWRPNDYYIIDQFMKLHDAIYYIGGMSAVYYHELIQQTVNQFTVYNDQYSGKKSFGHFSVIFIKTKSQNITGFLTVDVPNNGKVNIATLARTVLDLIQHWSRYQLLEEAYSWLEQFNSTKTFLDDLIELTTHCANQATIRRVGYCLEKFGTSDKKLLPLTQQLGETKSYIPLFPNLEIKGDKNKKWSIIENGK